MVMKEKTTYNVKNGKLSSTIHSVKNGNTTVVTTTTNAEDMRREERRNARERTRSQVQVVDSIFSFVLFILCLAVFARLLNGQSQLPTLESFLSMLGNAPIISNEFLLGLKSALTIGGDWGFLDGLRVFLNALGSLTSFGIWIVLGLFNVLTFALYFIGWIFGI